MTFLQDVNLAGNGLKEMPDFVEFAELETLVVRQNYIPKIHRLPRDRVAGDDGTEREGGSEMEEQSCLSHLDLYDNRISVIENLSHLHCLA